MTADAYSLQGLTQLYDTIKSVQKRQNRDLKIAGLLLVKYSGRSNLDRQVLDKLETFAAETGTKVFDAKIRECVKVKEAQEHNRLLGDYAPKCTTMEDYNAFVEELLG